MCSTHTDSINSVTSNEQTKSHLDNVFWQFSLTLYAKPEAANYCLKLQDQHHMQVNLLLYSIWLAFEGCILEPQLIKQNSQLQNWLTQIIPSIRYARKQVGEKSKQDPLYKQLKACELTAEQKAHALLFDLKRQTFQANNEESSLAQADFEYLLQQNLTLCWQAFSLTSVKIPKPELINEFSEWMIIDCQRKIASKSNH